MKLTHMQHLLAAALAVAVALPGAQAQTPRGQRPSDAGIQ